METHHYESRGAAPFQFALMDLQDRGLALQIGDVNLLLHEASQLSHTVQGLKVFNTEWLHRESRFFKN
jgi:hypothetical protein